MLGCGIALLGLVLPSPAASQTSAPPLGGSRCFVCVYSWQEAPPITNEAHTWATAIRVTSVAEGVVVETQTISWLPADVDIQVFSPRPETGRNFTLEESLALTRTRPKKVRISLWGPYEIRERTYDAFVNRKAVLESGIYRYRAIDSFRRETQNVNCIHAITDLDSEFERERYPLFRFGDRASAYIADQMRLRNVILDPTRTHDEWLPFFTLGYCIEQRELPPPCAYPVSDLRYAIRSRR